MHCPGFIANNNIWVSLIVGGIANGFLYRSSPSDTPLSTAYSG